MKPARTVSVSIGNLPAVLFDRVGDVFAPFRFGMKFARVAKRAQLAVWRRRERKTWPISQRPQIRGEMMFRRGVAFRFGVEIAVFDIHAHRQANRDRGAWRLLR